jgi:hypothetical protein
MRHLHALHASAHIVLSALSLAFETQGNPGGDCHKDQKLA